jgi:uncharacterized protein
MDTLDILWDGFCLASIVGIWPRFIEPRLLKTIRLKIPATIKKNLKIVQFSDLHFSKKMPDAFLSKILKRITQEKPDILVFTGDFLCFSQLEDPSRLLAFLSQMPKAPLGNFAVLGNHDYASFVSIGKSGNYSLIDREGSSILKGFQRMMAPLKPTGIIDEGIPSIPLHQPLIDLLAKSPFTLIENTSQTIDAYGSTLGIVGLGEYSMGKMREPKVPKADFTLTLLHNPDGARHLPPCDLILSGHTHGGQVNLPWLRKRFIVMEDTRLCKGLVKLDNGWIYISRGVGSVVPFRWFCPPEIVSIILESCYTLKHEKL